MTPDQRARVLLLSHLSPQQQETFCKHGWFEVKGGRTKRIYRVEPGRYPQRNVTRWRNDEPWIGYCAYPMDAGIAVVSLPPCDNALAQKMILEDRGLEDVFLSMACSIEYNGNIMLYKTMRGEPVSPEDFIMAGRRARPTPRPWKTLAMTAAMLAACAALVVLIFN